MSKVNDIYANRPHEVREAQCSTCGHTLTVVCPVGTTQLLECPHCIRQLKALEGWRLEYEEIKKQHQEKLARIAAGHNMRMWIVALVFFIPIILAFIAA